MTLPTFSWKAKGTAAPVQRQRVSCHGPGLKRLELSADWIFRCLIGIDRKSGSSAVSFQPMIISNYYATPQTVVTLLGCLGKVARHAC